MKQTVSIRDASSPSQSHEHGKVSLGPLLCWAVVFADIGSSIYYVPGILYDEFTCKHVAFLLTRDSSHV